MTRIITLRRRDGHTGEEMDVSYLLKGRVLRLERQSHGYMRVMLGHKSRHRFVHQIVLEAFVGPCPEGEESLHANDVGDDNRLSNLSWGTKARNQHDAIRNGKSPVGQAKPNSKLKDSDIAAIRARITTSGCAATAREFGVSETAIRNIKTGRSWRHVR